jgi:TIR domain
MPHAVELPPPRDWQVFEDFCRDLFAAEWGDPETQKHGRLGQQQQGIDVFGRRNGRWQGVQCKRRCAFPERQLTEKEVRAEVKAAYAFPRPIETLVIATTAPPDARIQDLAFKLTDDHPKVRDQGTRFRVVVLGWSELCERLQSHPDVFDSWSQRLLGRSQALGLEKLLEHDGESSRSRLRIFICYARKDGTLREDLYEHLALLRREGGISIWHDQDIGAGDNWHGRIHQQLETADVILLLVSASFIASDYCWDEEMRRALERHARGDARVVPIIVRSCDWKDSPLAQLQVLPTNGTAVTSWINTDEAWSDVAQGVRDVIDELRIDLEPTEHHYRAGAPSPGKSTVTDSIASLRARSLSEKELLDRVPELTAFSVGAIRFTMTEFEIPEHQRRFRGWWADHLNALVVNGKISQWRRAEGDALIVSARHERSLRDYRLGHSRVLDSSSLIIESCIPFRQDPVPGSSITPGEIRYPDLPIRSDYLDLVETAAGDHLLSLLKRGDMGSLGEFRPVVDNGQNEKYSLGTCCCGAVMTRSQ